MLNIINAYARRPAHNISHIFGMISNSYQFELSPADRQTLNLAILYHDYVYEPGSKTNEENSVKEFVLDISNNKIDWNRKLISQSDLLDQVTVMILDTYDHKPSEISELSKYLIDLDLWNLVDPVSYYTHTQVIRLEYIQVSNEIYYKARYDWLHDMLARNQIFYTDFCKSQDFDRRIRKNIKTELYRGKLDGIY